MADSAKRCRPALHLSRMKLQQFQSVPLQFLGYCCRSRVCTRQHVTSPAERQGRVTSAPRQWCNLSCRTVTLCQTEVERFAKYDLLLEKGEHCTLHHPHGQLQGRAGRRCILEDGERLLLRCVSLRPTAIRPRLVLMQNLLLQNRGREMEVPGLVLATLQHTKLRQSSLHTPFAQQAMMAIQYGITALKSSGRAYKVKNFLADAAHIVPDLMDPIDDLQQQSEKARKEHKTPFDSTVSHDDLQD